MNNSLIENYLRVLQDSEIVSELGIKGNIAAMLFLSPHGWTLWRKVAADNDKASELCGRYKISDQRDACILTKRIELSEKRIKLIKDEKHKCKDKRDEKKCRDRADERIEYEEKKIKKYEKKLEKLEEKGRGYDPKTY